MAHLILVLTLIVGAFLPPQAPQTQFLDFRLSAEKSTYLVCEPINLKMEVANTGTQPVRGNFDSFNFTKKELKLFYRKKGSEFKRYFSLGIWMAMSRDYIRVGEAPILEPGNQISTHKLVLFDTLPSSHQQDRFVFSDPGEYEFKATFQYTADSVIESNVLPVTVLAVPEREQDAFALWAQKDVALVVQGDILVAQNDIKKVEAVNQLLMFLQKFPRSPYAAYVRDAKELWLGYFERKTKQEKLTEEERMIYKLLHQPN